MQHKYLTEKERYQLELLLKQNTPKTQIAKILGVCRQTIYNEIKRGTVKQINTELIERNVYLADRGQQVQIDRGHNKGKQWKIENDYDFVRFVEYMITEMRYSPYALLHKAKELNFKTNICVSTLYSYIHKGVFLNVTVHDLPYAKKKKKKKIHRNVSLKLPCKPSIEDRPKEIYKRDSYGHWEMDTVYSGRSKSKSCLLVLTERQTRDELLLKMPNRKAESVTYALNKLYNIYGKEKFNETFKSITCDNGSEFADYENFSKDRFPVYFCHPYSSSERGSNENNNKLVRRWVKKGQSFANKTEKDIKFIEEWINNYPRKMFNGLSSKEYYSKLCTNS